MRIKVTDGSNVIAVDEAKDYLVGMLARAGVEPHLATVPVFWATFQEFCAVPTSYAPDTEILFQWGVYRVYAHPDVPDPDPNDTVEKFNFDFTRQFSVYDAEGEYDHMAQLNCTFYLDATDELREYEGNMWSMGFRDLEVFFRVVEDSEVFKLVVEHYAPAGVQIVLGDV